jgi:hypothetical protein
MNTENVGKATLEKFEQMDLTTRLRSNAYQSHAERSTTPFLTRQTREDQWDIDRQIHALQTRRRQLDSHPVSSSSKQRDSVDIFNRVFESLQCPNLTHLSLDFTNRDDVLRFPSLKHFIIKSDCKLASLTLLNANIAERFLVNTFDLLPTPRNLSVQESITAMPGLFCPKVVSALRSAPRVLPCLKHLVMEVSCKEGITDETVAELAICRAMNGLKTFSMELLRYELKYDAFACWKTTGHLPFHAEVKATSSNQKVKSSVCSCLQLSAV